MAVMATVTAREVLTFCFYFHTISCLLAGFYELLLQSQGLMFPPFPPQISFTAYELLDIYWRYFSELTTTGREGGRAAMTMH